MKKLLFLVVFFGIIACTTMASGLDGQSELQDDQKGNSSPSQKLDGLPSDEGDASDNRLKNTLTPGRNFDNPAANRFGDATLPNTFVPGHPGGYNLWISRENE